MTSESNKETKDKVAGKIARGILFAQERFSNWMNKLKSLKLVLICFCVISGSLSIYFFVDAIVSKPEVKIKIDHIRTPRPIYEPSEDMYDEKLPDDIYREIQEYRKYMDSIGEPIRPGLADSMRTVEEMYLQQQK
jgi:hypothetical protein